MSIEYKVNGDYSTDEFIEVLNKCSLGSRRPIEDRACMDGMRENATLWVTARSDRKLVGIARSVTDFYYCCYLSDLVVDDAFQHQGIGKKLIRLTQAQLKEKCSLILLAAPAAEKYYPHIGFQHHPQCWLLKPGEQLRD